MRDASGVRWRPVAARLLVCVALVAGMVPAGALAQGPSAVGGGEVKASRLVQTLPGRDSEGMAALGGPDFVSATPIAPGVTTGTFATTDKSRVYKIELDAGRRVSIQLSAAASTNFDLYLYRAPNSFGIVGSSWLDSYPESITHDVRAPLEGAYYIVVERFSGAGGYTLDVSVTDAPALGALHAIPGVPLTLPDAGGSLDRGTEPDHVYAVEIAAGQRLSVALDAVGGDADLFLFAPAATDVNVDHPVAGAATRAVPELLVYDVPAGAGGTYYLNVWAASGSPVYQLTCAIGPTPAPGANAEIPGVAAPASPVVSSLDGSRESLVYALPGVVPGDRIQLSLTGAEGTDFDLRLFAPDAGSVLSAVPVARSEFPVYPDAIDYAVPAGRGGTYYVEVRSHSGAGAFALTWSVGPRSGASIQRLDGQNRYLTAVAISRNAFADGSCGTVLLATGEAFADALAAASLAGAYEAPVLLTPTDHLPEAVLAEVRRLGAKRVIVVGGTAAVSPAVTDALTAANLRWTRIAGDDRFDTAAEIAERTVARLKTTGRTWDGTVFVVRSDGFADALAIAPAAYSRGVPILLTRPASLTSITRAALLTIKAEDVVVVGGGEAVSQATFDAIKRVPGIRRTDRVWGATRYDTAVAVAKYSLKYHWSSTDVVGVATGEDFADALSGGAAAGARGGVLVLTERDKLSAPSVGFLTERAGKIPHVHVYGGTVAVGATVIDQIGAIAP